METLVIIALSIIIAGFVILAGVAIWLAVDRRQHKPQKATSPRTPTAERPAQRPAPRPEVVSAATVEPTRPPREAAAAPAVKTPAPERDITSSAEYPSARTYDQTWLPDQPRKSKRQKTE
jgi:hypothetical protein